MPCKFVTGTCFTGDTLVYSKKGYVPIQTIRAGDDIYSREERTEETGFQTVEEVFLHTVHTIYTIEVNILTKIQT